MRIFKFFSKKGFLFLFILLANFCLLPGKAQAFSTPEESYQLLFEQAVFGSPDEMNLQSFVNETFKALTAATLVNPIMGCISCPEGEGNGGVIGSAAHLFAAMYTSPPASGIQYLADLGRKIGVAQPAYAQKQGIGFEAMGAIRPIWTAFRNISYVFFILIFIFIGFAIMFRVKINPQTVVTIQSALPKIVLALILVTFSYAIVGFMLDIMFVFLGLINHIFIGKEGLNTKLPGIIGSGADFLAELEAFFGTASPKAEIIFSGIFFFFAALLAFGASILLGGFSLLIAIVAIILILIAILRCGWTLLKAYAMIIVQLISAPFQILFGTLPGSGAIGGWFKNLVANILVFPTMFLIFHVTTYLILAGIGGIFSGNIFEIFGRIVASWFAITGFTVASVILPTGSFLELLSQFMLPIIGLVILLMAPKVSDMIKSFITHRPFEYGTAIGQAFGPITTGGKAGFYYGAETGIQTLEGAATAAGRTTGWDVTTARTLRRILGLKK